MLMLDQLELDLPCVVSRRASSLHKGCLDRVSGHTHPKLKSNTGGLEPF